MLSRADVPSWCKTCLNIMFRRIFIKIWTAWILVSFWSSRSQWFLCVYVWGLEDFGFNFSVTSCQLYSNTFFFMYSVSFFLFEPLMCILFHSGNDRGWVMDLPSTIDLQLMNQKNKIPTPLFRLLSFSVFQPCAGRVEFQTLWVWLFSSCLSWRSQRFCFQLLSLLIIICASLTFMTWMAVWFLFPLSMEI